MAFMRLLAQILDNVDSMEGVELALSESTASGSRESRRYNILKSRPLGASACRIEPILMMAARAAPPNPMRVLVRDKIVLEEAIHLTVVPLRPSFFTRHASQTCARRYPFHVNYFDRAALANRIKVLRKTDLRNRHPQSIPEPITSLRAPAVASHAEDRGAIM